MNASVQFSIKLHELKIMYLTNKLLPYNVLYEFTFSALPVCVVLRCSTIIPPVTGGKKKK
jgi:hypothetical protein